jgi:hypothetical protein
MYGFRIMIYGVWGWCWRTGLYEAALLYIWHCWKDETMAGNVKYWATDSRSQNRRHALEIIIEEQEWRAFQTLSFGQFSGCSLNANALSGRDPEVSLIEIEHTSPLNIGSPAFACLRWKVSGAFDISTTDNQGKENTPEYRHWSIELQRFMIKEVDYISPNAIYSSI